MQHGSHSFKHHIQHICEVQVLTVLDDIFNEFSVLCGCFQLSLFGLVWGYVTLANPRLSSCLRCIELYGCFAITVYMCMCVSLTLIAVPVFSLRRRGKLGWKPALQPGLQWCVRLCCAPSLMQCVVLCFTSLTPHLFQLPELLGFFNTVITKSNRSNEVCVTTLSKSYKSV